eukprot:13404979-Heterocapsa_arctica.AAC.1
MKSIILLTMVLSIMHITGGHDKHQIEDLEFDNWIGSHRIKNVLLKQNINNQAEHFHPQPFRSKLKEEQFVNIKVEDDRNKFNYREEKKRQNNIWKHRNKRINWPMEREGAGDTKQRDFVGR